MKMASRTLIACVGILFLWNASAEAASISISNVTLDISGTTPDGSANSDKERNISASAVTNSGGTASGGVGTSVDASGQFSASVSAKETTVDIFTFPTATRDFAADFTFSFDVVASASTTWSLDIANSRLGELSVIDDSLDTGGTGSANISGSTALINGISDAALDLALASSGTINQTGATTLSGSGNQSFALNFVWTAQASSISDFLTDGDSAALMFGLDASGDHVNDYPRIGGIVAADDGHFMNVTATIESIASVPEPTGVAFLSLAFVGIGGVVRRRRK